MLSNVSVGAPLNNTIEVAGPDASNVVGPSWSNGRGHGFLSFTRIFVFAAISLFAGFLQ
jgi:hypothetical protein